MVHALGSAPKVGTALDLGAGGLNDSRYLLSLGYTVTAVDRDQAAADLAREIKGAKFNFLQQSFEDLEFTAQQYDLVSAQFALPFIQKKEDLLRVVHGIKQVLKPGGVFAGQFFGPKDTWCLNDRPMTFLAKDEVEALFADMDIILIGEREYDGVTALGQKKHWHMFPVIVKKVN